MSSLDESLAKALERQRTTRPAPPADTETQNTETQKPTHQRVEAPANRGRGGHFQATNPHTKRLTVDLTPHQDRVLAQFALNIGSKKNPILRRVVELIEQDANFRNRIAEGLTKEQPQR